MMALTMDYDAIAKAGSMLGSGAVIVLDETRCMVKSLLRLSYFYFEESCGQCTPCREGTGWLWRMVDRIEHGTGRPEDIDVLTSVADNIQGRTICALGDAAALPVKSFVKHFRERVRAPHRAQALPGRFLRMSSPPPLNIEIDGRAVQVPHGSTVMDAANKLGIYVPHFCYHKKLSIAANCRMCLVQVEKAPKPLPACATPVTEGMKAWSHSEQAIKAQQGVMEFLLINHPLDCPICDQGGECQLQDLAVGYGGSASRYREKKRVVFHKYMGPLISAEEMTRCIHCTRCVRFGQEIAGIMELGMSGRGEHAEIETFVGRTVDSELSGNMIDLCPVGALTSKPFRYAARTWELSRRKSVSPHDGARQQPGRAGEERSRDARAAARERSGQRVLAVGQGPLLVRGAQHRGAADVAAHQARRRMEGRRLADGARIRRQRRCATSSRITAPRRWERWCRRTPRSRRWRSPHD